MESHLIRLSDFLMESDSSAAAKTVGVIEDAVMILERHPLIGRKLDERMREFRWLLEELRVSLFAQELRTPQPVSVKRLEKAWAQLMH